MGVLSKIVPKPRGTYSSSAVYNTLDIVRYTNKVFMCRQDNVQGIVPAEGMTWMFLVQDGDGGGSDTFADLSDVNLSNIQGGQIPRYNSIDGVWENHDIPSALKGYEYPAPFSEGNYIITLSGSGWTIGAGSFVQAVLSVSVDSSEVSKFKGIIPLGARMWWEDIGTYSLMFGVITYKVNNNGDIELGLIGQNPSSVDRVVKKIYLSGILI